MIWWNCPHCGIMLTCSEEYVNELTICPGCGKTVVRRRGFEIRDIRINHGRCAYCAHAIPGIWE